MIYKCLYSLRADWKRQGFGLAYVSRIRLFVEQPLTGAEDIALDKGQSHYLLDIMRCKPNDPISLFDGASGEWLGNLEFQNRRSVNVVSLHKVKDQIAEPDLWLIFAPLKKSAQRFQIQKATELGVSSFYPVKTNHAELRGFNHGHALATAVEAAEQCGRMTVPTIAEPQPLGSLLNDWPADRPLLFCDENLLDRPMTIPDMGISKAASPGGAVLIGPAGGFSDAERNAIQSVTSAIPISLGPRVLKADTATVAGLMIWHLRAGQSGPAAQGGP